MSKLTAFCPHCGKLIHPISRAEKVIEHYYRARAAGHKVTLRQLAQQSGFNADYLSQVKAAYDRAGKWGSKPRKSLP